MFKVTLVTVEQGVKYVQSLFIANFEHSLHLVLVFLLLTLSRYMPATGIYI